MRSGVIAALVLGVLLLIGGAFYVASNGTEEISENVQVTELYSPNEVATHNSQEDCWTIIDDSVYDITAYIQRHPGGAEILRTCGTDGSSLFNSRTTLDGETVGSGSSHSSNASRQLSSLKIGTLDN